MTETTHRTDHWVRIFRAFVVVGLMSWLGLFVYNNVLGENPQHPFKLGLDLAGGAQLTYEADVSDVDPLDVPALMEVLRTVIEERINAFGVSEPVVYVEKSSFVSDTIEHRLVVELPGVTKVEDAVAEIGRTPLLEFKLVNEEALAAQQQLQAQASSGALINVTGINGEKVSAYEDTGLTGRYLESAQLQFAGGSSGQLANEPVVAITFNTEGAALFADITRDHVGESLAIFLDGQLLSAPRINETIVGGTAIISGNFNPDEARALAQNLSFGALPVPIELASTQTIDATLGAGVINESLKAGAVGLLAIMLFMTLWYRLPGFVASIALVCYVLMSLAIFMYIPVTITAAGIAGFILSLGMAVDANVLVFERMKEEWRAGRSSHEAALIGFSRAWSAIRDSNVTGLLSAVILFWFGTALIKGFAFVLGIGIIVAVVSAITLTRTFLLALPEVKAGERGVGAFLFGVGFKK